MGSINLLIFTRKSPSLKFLLVYVKDIFNRMGLNINIIIARVVAELNCKIGRVENKTNQVQCSACTYRLLQTEAITSMNFSSSYIILSRTGQKGSL